MAESNAALHAILKGHQNSKIFYFARVRATMTQLSQPVLNANRSAKLDVYDYAAHFDVLPEFELEKIPLSNDIQSKTGYLCRVHVKGTNVIGEGLHRSNSNLAEVAACMDFKIRAEKAHQGQKFLVKHINTLTTQTGQKFLEYCKLRSKDWALYRFESKRNYDVAVGKLFLADRLIAECSAQSYSPL